MAAFTEFGGIRASLINRPHAKTERRHPRIVCPVPLTKGRNECYNQPRSPYVARAGGPMDWLKSKLSQKEPEKFMPMQISEDDGVLGGDRFGPTALLLMGFEASELQQVDLMLADLGASFVDVKVVTQAMMQGTLQQALNVQQDNPKQEAPAENVPRIVFLSGLSSGEVIQVMDEFHSTGLPMPAFAVAVPNAVVKPIKQLAEEIMGDHMDLLKQRMGTNKP